MAQNQKRLYLLCSVSSFCLSLQLHDSQKSFPAPLSDSVKVLQNFVVKITFLCSDVLNDRLGFECGSRLAISELFEHLAMPAKGGTREVAVHSYEMKVREEQRKVGVCTCGNRLD
jgi:hypothetical protein